MPRRAFDLRRLAELAASATSHFRTAPAGANHKKVFTMKLSQLTRRNLQFGLVGIVLTRRTGPGGLWRIG
jgi:hypothetical protein